MVVLLISVPAKLKVPLNCKKIILSNNDFSSVKVTEVRATSRTEIELKGIR